MSDPFFDYIHDSTRSVSRQLYGFENKEKCYDRLEYQSLLYPKEDIGVTLTQSLRVRKKAAAKLSQRVFSLSQMSSLLGLAIAQDDRNQGYKHYSFPSGGGLYPMETYICVNNIEGLAPGVYHYSSVKHAIALIGKEVQLSLEVLNELYGSDLEVMPAALIIMTSVKSRYIHKYGNLGYKLCLVEAGHRGQNICLVASAMNLAVCPLGGGDPTGVHSLLGVDGVNEHHIYAFAVWGSELGK